MARRKLTPIVTPNTLESKIEYTLISSILNTICEMTKKPIGISRRRHHANPPQHLLVIFKAELTMLQYDNYSKEE
jgi:phosphopantothenoylcysteine synthetase/decarboxylase